MQMFELLSAAVLDTKRPLDTHDKIEAAVTVLSMASCLNDAMLRARNTGGDCREGLEDMAAVQHRLRQAAQWLRSMFQTDHKAHSSFKIPDTFAALDEVLTNTRCVAPRQLCLHSVPYPELLAARDSRAAQVACTCKRLSSWVEASPTES